MTKKHTEQQNRGWAVWWFAFLILLLIQSSIALGASPGTIKWSYPVDEGCVTPAIGHNGTIYVSSGSQLLAINPNGTLKWSFDTGLADEYVGIPSVDSQDNIYFVVSGNSPSYIYALSSNKNLLWKKELLSGGFGSSCGEIAISPDSTIYASGSSRIQAFDPTGQSKWIAQGGQLAPAISQAGNIFAINWSDSSPLVELDSINGLIINSSPVSIRVNHPNPPAMGINGDIYIAGDGASVAFSNNLTQSWRNISGGRGEPPVIDVDGTVYYTSRDGGGFYFDAVKMDGTSKFKFTYYPPDTTVAGTPAIGNNGYIYVPSTYEGLVAFNNAGDVQWHTGGAFKNSSTPAIMGSDGTIYLIGYIQEDVPIGQPIPVHYSLYAIQSSSTGPAPSAWPMYGANAQHTHVVSDVNALTPIITSITPTIIPVNQPVTFTVAGLNLPDGLSFNLPGCSPAPEQTGGTATQRLFACTPTQTGTLTAEVKNAQGNVVSGGSVQVTVSATAPTVTSITPTVVTQNVPATFTVVGTNLPDGLSFNLLGCSLAPEQPGGTATQRQFACTPTQTGTLTAEVKNAMGSVVSGGSVQVTILAGVACEQKYPSYDEVISRLRKLDNDPRGIAKVFDIGTTDDNKPPAERIIRAIKISSNVASDDKSKPDILIVGGHHAREWISIIVPLCIAENLVSHYDDPEIKRLVDSREIWIVPLLNPDGYEYSRTKPYDGMCEDDSPEPRCWRKNRRDLTPAVGVDLNRNYDYYWSICKLINTCEEEDPDSITYRGERPFSEFETISIKKLVEGREKEKNNFKRLLSYHSCGQAIMYPWGFIDGNNVMEATFHKIANEMKIRTGQDYCVDQPGECVGYNGSGDLVDWAFGEKAILGFTIELPPKMMRDSKGDPTKCEKPGFTLPESEIDKVFKSNWEAVRYFISCPDCGPIYLPGKYASRMEATEPYIQGSQKTFEFTNDVAQQSIKINLTWPGSAFGMEVYRPGGSLFADITSRDPPIEVDVDNAELGKWTIKVTATELGAEEQATLAIGTYNPDDPDHDGKPNAVDNCPLVGNPDQTDGDRDGVGDACDNCPVVANADQLDVYPLDAPEGPGNTVGDACEQIPPDMDGDGKDNTVDNCPWIPNPDQADTDSDGIGDRCDNCPSAKNADQRDSNRNGIGDACESLPPGTTFTGSTITGTGSATATVSGGSTGCIFDPAQTGFVNPITAPPAGVQFPHGLFRFRLVNCDAGGAATLRVQWPAPANGQYWKYNPVSQRWYAYPGASFDAATSTWTFTITDNGPQDADPTPGAITDPAGPALRPTDIPTLSQWAMLLLVATFLGIALLRQGLLDPRRD